MGAYNYPSFPLDGDMADFERFKDRARVGTKAPAADVELTRAADGERVRLESLFLRGLTVIEFGSFT